MSDTGVGDTGQDAREQALTEEVVASFVDTPSPRLREIMESVVRHLHAVVRETRLTEAEWEQAIGFLTAAGHITDDRRQEFILLSDVLGVSMQTITVNDTAAGEVTEATVWGPFFVEGSPAIALGGDIAQGAPGEPCWVEGTVRSATGEPLPGALIEVWEADDDGQYDVQYDDDRTSARGHLVADASGAYRFWALTPTPYPIPDDGPVGQLLTATNRSPMRAPHLHFMVTAEGHRRVVTHIFTDGDGDTTRDSVFGVRESLVKPFSPQPTGTPTPDGRAVDGPWSRVTFDIVLAADAAPSGSERS